MAGREKLNDYNPQRRLDEVNLALRGYVAEIADYERKRDSLPDALGLLYRLKELTPTHRKLMREWRAACKERDGLVRILSM